MNYRTKLPLPEQDSVFVEICGALTYRDAEIRSDKCQALPTASSLQSYTPEVFIHEKCFNRYLYSMSWIGIDGLGSGAKPATFDTRSATFGGSGRAPDARTAALDGSTAECTGAGGSHESYRLSHEGGFRSIQHRG
jgi:hypothetical protein